jgi:hypothetical protein
VPAPTIALSWQPHAVAYGWLVDRLRADADFRRVIKTFVHRIPGTSNDDNPPTPAMCPWVRLTPSPESQYPIYTAPRDFGVFYEAPLTVQVETCVAGFGPSAGMGPWSLIWEMLWGSKVTRSFVTSHRNAFINHLTPDQPPAIESAQPESGSGLVYGAGTIRLYVRA